jgi:hypothetical protein
MGMGVFSEREEQFMTYAEQTEQLAEVQRALPMSTAAKKGKANSKGDTVTLALIESVTVSVPDYPESTISVAVPDFAKMTDEQFDTALRSAILQAKEHNAKCGLAIYNIVLPALEYADQQFKQGKTINGCKGKEAYVRSLGLKEDTVRQWKLRAKKAAEARKALEHPSLLLNGEIAPNTKVTKKTREQTTTPAEVPMPRAGEWKLIEESEDTKFWENTDGRMIARRFDDEKKPIFTVGDQWGRVDEVNTLEEAMQVVRPAAKLEDTLKLADAIAKEMAKDKDEQSDIESVVMDYLAARRISPPSSDDESRRTPEYEITIRVKAHKLVTVEKKAKETFGNDLRSLKKISRNTSRAAELDLAEEHFNACKEIVADLKDQMEEWRDNVPDSLQSSEKYSEVESCVDQLQQLEDELDGISFDSIEFPSAF